MGYMIKLWEKLVHDESASDTLVEYLDFVECEMLVERTMMTTASLAEGSSEEGGDPEGARDLNETADAEGDDYHETVLEDDIQVAPPVPQLTAVYLIKESRKWVNRVILACHKDVRDA